MPDAELVLPGAVSDVLEVALDALDGVELVVTVPAELGVGAGVGVGAEVAGGEDVVECACGG